jgi:Fur family transcriptional regulator, iron response regulator
MKSRGTHAPTAIDGAAIDGVAALQLGRPATLLILGPGGIELMTTSRPLTSDFELLRAAHMRATRQRLALVRVLFEQGDRHVTAEQLHGEVVEGAVRVSLATVYNTLHQFVEAGMLREVVVNSGCSYFDTNVSDHHHFLFEDTGRLLDIPGEHVAVWGLPEPPAGAAIRRIEVIIRLDRDPAPVRD